MYGETVDECVIREANEAASAGQAAVINVVGSPLAAVGAKIPRANGAVSLKIPYASMDATGAEDTASTTLVANNREMGCTASGGNDRSTDWIDDQLHHRSPAQLVAAITCSAMGRSTLAGGLTESTDITSPAVSLATVGRRRPDFFG